MFSYLFPNYNRQDVTFSHGEGAYLYDISGKEYLDFATGIAVCGLGHAHPKLLQALQKQSHLYWHCSNLYGSNLQHILAEKLVNNSFKTPEQGQVFFCNSGVEALEGAFKTARYYHYAQNNPHKTDIIAFHDSFHGRSMATLAATGRAQYLTGFGPTPKGYKQCPFGNDNILRDMIDDNTAAILIEPIQGEGGINSATHDFLHKCRDIANEYGLLLLADEVQCGVGRTGKFWAHQWADIEVDIIASAKGLGGGFPVGAFIAKETVSRYMQPGTHGSTYGGNALAMAVATEVVDIVSDTIFLQHVADMGAYLHEQLHILQQKHQHITQIKGKNLICGIELQHSDLVQQFSKGALEHGLLCVPAAHNVIRLLPPLIIEKTHINEAISIIDNILKDMSI